MQKLLLALPLLLFLAATVMLIFTMDSCYRIGDGFGMAFVAVAIAYVASAIACRQQSK
jgi:hypothetical protein